MSPLFTKLSFIYFCYFSAIGLVVPFLSVYLDYLGYSSVELGELIAIFTAMKIIGPTFWASYADKTGQQLKVIQLGSFFTMLCFCLLFVVEGYWPVSFSLAIFGLFWTSILPQLEAMTNKSIRRSAKIYARIRLWGSIGFIVTAVIAGELMLSISPNAFLWLGLLIVTGLWLSSINLKQPYRHTVKQAKAVSMKNRVFTKSFIGFFIAGMLLQISFGPFYNFFALYLRDLSYPGYAAGLLLALGVLAEVVIFYYLAVFYRYFSIRSLLLLSLVLTALRWWLVAAFGNNVIILILSQLIHAFSFGIYHSASMQFLLRHFTSQQQNRAQALYISGVFGIGGALGAYLAGLLWQEGAGAEQTFMLAAATSLVASFFVLMLSKKRVSPN